MTSKTEDLLEAWGAFFVSHALAVRRIEDNLKGRVPLSLDEYDVLLGISRSEGGRIRYAELASVTVFTRSGITRVAKRLKERGLLEREECPEDRRGAYAVLSRKGENAMRDTWKLYSKEILLLLEPCFSQAEARQLKVLLEKIIGPIQDSRLVQISK